MLFVPIRRVDVAMSLPTDDDQTVLFVLFCRVDVAFPAPKKQDFPRKLSDRIDKMRKNVGDAQNSAFAMGKTAREVVPRP